MKKVKKYVMYVVNYRILSIDPTFIGEKKFFEHFGFKVIDEIDTMNY